MIVLWLATGVLANGSSAPPAVTVGGGIIDDFFDQRRDRIKRQNAVIMAVVSEFLKAEK